MFRLVAACLVLAVPMPAAAAPPSAPIANSIARLDAIFAEYQPISDAPGLVYGIVADGRLVHVRGFGVQDLSMKKPVSADSLFRIASMSKAFTALAILKLRDEGKLSLDALAETYVPEMRGWRYPTADSPRIRVRDLLSHTAGFVTDDPWGDRQQVLSEADFTRMLKAGVPFSRTPGTAMEYSNFGYALLGRIITNVSGMPYDRYINGTIQRPLGMAATGYEVRDWPIERRAIGYRFEHGAFKEEPTMRHGTFGAMGGVQTSASDYAKWVAFLLSAWPPRDGADAGPVRRSTIREMAQGATAPSIRPRFGRSARDDCPQAAAYGMGFHVVRDCELGTVIMHGGGYPGYGSHVMLMLDHGVGVFVFTNRTYNGGAGPAWDAAAMLFKAGALIVREQPVTPSLAAAYAAAGAMYRAGSVGPGKHLLAMNFLMDRSSANWVREFDRLEAEVGACQTQARPKPTGALSATFRWACEKGAIEGTLLLAPTVPATIQALRLSSVATTAAK